MASFTADGAYDQEGVSAAFAERHPDALVIVPPRSTAVPSETAETRRRSGTAICRCITEHGRAAWQKASGYSIRARVEATIGRFKQVIGDGLRCRTDQRRATEVDVAVHASNRMLQAGTPDLRPHRLNPYRARPTAFILSIYVARPIVPPNWRRLTPRMFGDTTCTVSYRRLRPRQHGSLGGAGAKPPAPLVPAVPQL